MNCKDAREKLECVANGELSGDEARAVREHYAACAECCTTLSASEWVEILPALDAPTLEPSNDFAARFHAKLDARPKPWWSRMQAWGLPRRLVAAGALASIALAGIIAVKRPEPGQERAAFVNEIQIAQDLPLLQDMAVVNNLDLLEDFDTIENLPQLIHEKGIN